MSRGGRWGRRGGTLVAVVAVLGAVHVWRSGGGPGLTGHATGAGCGGRPSEKASLDEATGLRCAGPSLLLANESVLWRCQADVAIEPRDPVAASPFHADLVDGANGPLTEFALELTYRGRASERPGVVAVRFTVDGVARELPLAVVGRTLAVGKWDRPARVPRCASTPGAALDRALGAAGLERRDFAQTLAGAPELAAGLLKDEFRLAQLDALRTAPHAAGCIEGQNAAVLDALADGAHPVAEMIRHAARGLNVELGEQRPYAASLDALDDAIEGLCAVAGDCSAATGDLPEDLRAALARVVWSIRAGLIAQYGRDKPSSGRDADFWRDNGGHGLLFTTTGAGFGHDHPTDRAYLSAPRAAVYVAAARIAHAVEDTDWSAFEGRAGVRFDLETAAGAIVVRDAADDRYEQDRAVLLLVDLGGDDVHHDAVASNLTGANAVSVAIDLGGDDEYLAGSDDPRHVGDRARGRISLSDGYRQGAARNGIAMLFDLGDGGDTYEARRASQGYAHQGVGVLFDGGGDDRYVTESAAQGAAQFGIALAIDAGAGDDDRRSVHASQGFGYAGGVGILFAGGGDDSYLCDPQVGGDDLLFPAPQTPDGANVSLCQGAGFGFRSDDPKTSLSGGLGILRDRAGDDRYQVGVMGQGVGYWQGVGLLSDGAGADRYDGLIYAQGAAVHFGAGVLADDGDGDDAYGTELEPDTVTLGAAHDFGVGVSINEGGADRYRIRGVSAGAAQQGGVGLFIDNAGGDRYEATSIQSGGVARIGELVGVRTIAIMIDAGGVDEYVYPRGPAAPTEGGQWGPGEGEAAHGAGLDTDEATGVNATGAP